LANTDDLDICNAIFKSFSSVLQMVTDEMNHKLTQEITLEELKTAVVSLSCGKALGHDGLPMKFFQEIVEEITLELLAAYQAMLQLGQLSNKFNQGWIVLIPKSGDPSLIKHQRPITLLKNVYKVLAKLLMIRIHIYLISLGQSRQGLYQGGAYLCI